MADLTSSSSSTVGSEEEKRLLAELAKTKEEVGRDCGPLFRHAHAL
jgi:hypothetical protein